MSLPEAAVADPAPRAAPAHRLFSSQNVGLATFLGSLLAGSILLAINYRRLGDGRRALLAIAFGALATAFLIAFALLAPDSVPQPIYTGVAIGLAFAMRAVTDALQGEALAAHRTAGGRVGAGWAGAGIALATLAVILGLLFGAFWLADDSVQVDQVTVHYGDGATETEARATGEYLRSLGMADREIELHLLRRDGKLHLLLPVPRGRASTDEFRELGRHLSGRAFAGAPIVLDLADENLEVHTSIPIDPG